MRNGDELNNNPLSKKLEEAQQATDSPFTVLARMGLDVATLAVPPVAVLKAFIEQYLPKRREERLYDFLWGLVHDLERLRDSIDTRLVRTDEFEALFERTLHLLTTTAQEKKLHAFRAILLNSLIPPVPPYELQDFFLSALDSFSLVHIELLHVLANPGPFVPDNTFMGGLDDVIGRALPDYPEEVLSFALDDLYARGFTNTPSRSLKTSMTRSGMEAKRITEFGEQFVRFITIPGGIGGEQMCS